MRSDEAVALYIEDCTYRNLSPKTITGYKWATRRLVEHGPELPRTAHELQRILTVPEYADESRRDLWRAMRTFYGWLERTHGVANPMSDVRAPRRRAKFPRTLNDLEVQALFDATTNRRDIALLAVLLDTGIRVSELAGLTWPVVDDQGIEVYGKTGSRFVPMSPRARATIEGLGNEVHIWVGKKGPLTASGVMQVVRRAMYRAGLRLPKCGPHTLRHTFAKRFLRFGGHLAALQGLLGHESIESTMIYARMADADLIRQHQEFSPLRGVEICATRTQSTTGPL